MSLFNVSLLLFQINSKLCCFKVYKVSGGGSGKTENKNVSFDKMKDLYTVILPIVVSLCFFPNCYILTKIFDSLFIIKL